MVSHCKLSDIDKLQSIISDINTSKNTTRSCSKGKGKIYHEKVLKISINEIKKDLVQERRQTSPCSIDKIIKTNKTLHEVKSCETENFTKQIDDYLFRSGEDKKLSTNKSDFSRQVRFFNDSITKEKNIKKSMEEIHQHAENENKPIICQRVDRNIISNNLNFKGISKSLLNPSYACDIKSVIEKRGKFFSLNKNNDSNFSYNYFNNKHVQFRSFNRNLQDNKDSNSMETNYDNNIQKSIEDDFQYQVFNNISFNGNSKSTYLTNYYINKKNVKTFGKYSMYLFFNITVAKTPENDSFYKKGIKWLENNKKNKSVLKNRINEENKITELRERIYKSFPKQTKTSENKIDIDESLFENKELMKVIVDRLLKSISHLNLQNHPNLEVKTTFEKEAEKNTSVLNSPSQSTTIQLNNENIKINESLSLTGMDQFKSIMNETENKNEIPKKKSYDQRMKELTNIKTVESLITDKKQKFNSELDNFFEKSKNMIDRHRKNKQENK